MNKSTFLIIAPRHHTLGTCVDVESLIILKERFKCPHFRILVMGRANAGKTTILQKVCAVAPGTKPIIYDKDGVKIKGKSGLLSGVQEIFGRKSSKGSGSYLMPSREVRDIFDIWMCPDLYSNKC